MHRLSGARDASTHQFSDHAVTSEELASGLRSACQSSTLVVVVVIATTVLASHSTGLRAWCLGPASGHPGVIEGSWMPAV